MAGKAQNIVANPFITTLNKATAKQSAQIASCLVLGACSASSDQESISTLNARVKSKRPLSAENSMEEAFSKPIKFWYEDLTSITEDKELSQLDSLTRKFSA